MVETVLAVLVITFLFLVLFKLAHMLMGKIMLEHAAMRVARARAVGCNGFMCLKAARVAVIPAAGERLTPGKDDERKNISETALAHRYMGTPDINERAVALRGVAEPPHPLRQLGSGVDRDGDGLVQVAWRGYPRFFPHLPE